MFGPGPTHLTGDDVTTLLRARADDTAARWADVLTAFLAAQPANQVHVAHRAGGRAGQATQHLVAGAVAMDVVDLLEVIRIHHHHRQVITEAARAHELGIAPLQQRRTVGSNRLLQASCAGLSLA